MEWLFFIVAIICLFGCGVVFFVLGTEIEPDCDNCEYATECRKRKDMLEGLREDSN